MGGGRGRAVSGERAPRRGRAPGDPEVKRRGDWILKAVRSAVSERAGDDADLGLELNRWVFGRLQQDEIRTKRPIKKALWDWSRTYRTEISTQLIVTSCLAFTSMRL